MERDGGGDERRWRTAGHRSRGGRWRTRKDGAEPGGQGGMAEAVRPPGPAGDGVWDRSQGQGLAEDTEGWRGRGEQGEPLRRTVTINAGT